MLFRSDLSYRPFPKQTQSAIEQLKLEDYPVEQWRLAGEYVLKIPCGSKTPAEVRALLSGHTTSEDSENDTSK